MAKTKSKKPVEAPANPLAVFDELKSAIAEFVAPIQDIRVSDEASAVQAVDVAKRVKAYINAAEDKRKELVGPLNERVRQINDYVKDLTLALKEASAHVQGQLNAFAEKQEALRQAELARIAREREEAEAKARAERERIEEELRQKQEAEAEQAVEARDWVGTGGEPVDEVNDRVQEKLETEWNQTQAELDQAEALRAAEFRAQQHEAEQLQIKNTRREWKCELVDINQVPVQYLKRELNTQAVLAAARGGFTAIPGVRLWQEAKVAIGKNTYVPGASNKGGSWSTR